MADDKEKDKPEQPTPEEQPEKPVNPTERSRTAATNRAAD